MKKLITLFGGILVMIFSVNPWVHHLDTGVKFGLYDIAKAFPPMFAMIAISLLFGLLLVILPLILRNPTRLIVVVILSIIGFIMLAAMPSMLPPDFGLGRAWYGSLTGYLLALLGGFFGGTRRLADNQIDG
jgi:hypothetical protein